jgi:hypothetical protein
MVLCRKNIPIMNKKLSLLPLFLFISLIYSCSETDAILDKLRTINDIPATADLSIAYLPINLFEIPLEKTLNLRQIIEDELGSDEVLNQVKEIELDDLSIDLISADNQENFDFLDSVTLGIETENLPYVEIANLDVVPTGVTTMDLETTNDLHIDEYAKSENLKLVVRFKSTQDARNLEIRLRMKFDAKLDPSL